MNLPATLLLLLYQILPCVNVAQHTKGKLESVCFRIIRTEYPMKQIYNLMTVWPGE